MKIQRFAIQLIAIFAVAMGSFHSRAGTVSYVPIPATSSDAGSGISTDNVYTTAVNGGNTSGTDVVVNGVPLHALVASGSSCGADNMFLNATTGSLTNAGGSSSTIAADGALAQALASMTFNQDAEDGSQQEIVLDPASLASGKTYDLRVYLCNSAGQNRLVDLSFAGDGQGAVDTGTFNEDDATTSAGGFSDKNQVYYIDYRYTWDGDTTPGITITQPGGSNPFCLYAVTNQEVAAGATAAPPAPAAPVERTDLTLPGTQAGSDQTAPVGENGGGFASTDQVDSAAAQSDVGTGSEDFYHCDCLAQHGTWVNVGTYGTCWQPSGCGPDWRPYTCGHWGYSGECGYTWVCNSSEEDWGWACYHYGRWARCAGVGWCWCPGRVWAPAWVSWRTGDDSCGCVGWAPLPPECGCQVGIGVSTWVDSRYGLGPGCYSFCGINNLGAANLSTVIYNNERTVNIFNRTTNITNISYNRNSRTFFTGGPNITKVNTLIAKNGGKVVQNIVVNRNPNTLTVAGGKHSSLKGNVLTLAAPNVVPAKKITSKPTPSTVIPASKVDHGWSAVKDPKVAQALKAKITKDAAGKTPQTTKATLPPEAAKAALAHPIGAPGQTNQPKAGLHPGITLKNAGQTPGGNPAGPGAKGALHPGITLKNAGQIQGAHPAGPGAKGTLHPGITLKNTGAAPGTVQPGPKAPLHPGKSIKQSGLSAGTPGNAGGPAGATGPHPGVKKGVPGTKGLKPAGPANPEGTPAPTPGTLTPHTGKTLKHHGKGIPTPTPPSVTKGGEPGQTPGAVGPHPGKTPKHPAKGLTPATGPNGTSEGAPTPSKRRKHPLPEGPTATNPNEMPPVRHPAQIEKPNTATNPPQLRRLQPVQPKPHPQIPPQDLAKKPAKGSPTPIPR